MKEEKRTFLQIRSELQSIQQNHMICETMDLIHYQFTQIASIYNFIDFSTAMSNLELSYVGNFGSLGFRDEAKIFELSELGIHEQHKVYTSS